ncbi:MAG: hypothetical protein U5J97_10235 [Trueperaceae bacterium]|nr:hypothetical protein [Trueperaceae bacterium]
MNVVIRTGDDLAAALRHPEPRVRVAVLRDVASDPERLARYGGAAGRDLVGELLLLCRESAGSADRVGYAYALLQLDDPRVTTFAKHEFVHGDHAKLALVAAARLATLPAHERVATLAPVITGRYGPTRQRGAANLLADVPDLEPAVALRVALLTDHPVAPPPLTTSTLGAWLTELDGDRPAGARAALRRGGPTGLLTLLRHWETLPETLRAWTLRWADEGAQQRRRAADRAGSSRRSRARRCADLVR